MLKRSGAACFVISQARSKGSPWSTVDCYHLYRSPSNPLSSSRVFTTATLATVHLMAHLLGGISNRCPFVAISC